jgi:ComF family protein
LNEPTCAKCGKKRSTSYPSPDCGNCFGRKYRFYKARAFFEYDAGGSKALLAFKKAIRLSVGEFLCDRALAALDDAGGLPRIFHEQDFSADVLVPVPRHFLRSAPTGFNQARLIAQRVSAHTDVPVKDWLVVALRKLRSQKGLSYQQRVENRRGAYRLSAPKEDVADKTVIVVDDLMTTGATLNECARVLLKAGAKRVYALALFTTK